LISCLTDCLCNLGSKYNGRICPRFINSKSGKQSYPQSFCNIIVDWWDQNSKRVKGFDDGEVNKQSVTKIE
jgi:hypothetical protein